jgi:hypothetical protein
MATDGQFSWPSVSSSVAAYGQFFMAANMTAPSITTRRPPGPDRERTQKSGPRQTSLGPLTLALLTKNSYISGVLRHQVGDTRVMGVVLMPVWIRSLV